MAPFDFATTPQIRQGAGASGTLGAQCTERGASSVLLVTDPGIEKLGLLEGALKSFQAEGLPVSIYSRVEADPSDAIVLAALHEARTCRADCIVGFGGGSSMDVAKVVALLASPQCAQSLPDLYGVGQARGHRLPLIQVPTTAGTGSEMTPIAIVTTGKTTKSGIVSPLLLPDIAVLDPELTMGLPAAVTAATGIDAMVHAIEAYTSRIRKNPVSDMLAREALRLLCGNLLTAIDNGGDMEARSALLLGSSLAGQAFANAPVAAVHALAYPLGGHFHVPHGLSNSLVLPHVLRFNLEAATPLYAELAPIVMGGSCDGDGRARAEQMIKALEALIEASGLPQRLRDVGVPNEFLPTLARDAMLQQRLLVNNPRDVEETDALAIYQAAF